MAYITYRHGEESKGEHSPQHSILRYVFTQIFARMLKEHVELEKSKYHSLRILNNVYKFTLPVEMLCTVN